MSNFWDILYLIASAFFFVAYLIVLFHVVIDLFRDAELGGVSKGSLAPWPHLPAGLDRAHLYPGPGQRHGGAAAHRDAAGQI